MYADEEYLEAVVVAEVTEEPRLVLTWRGKEIVNISRAFLDTNGAHQETDVKVEIPAKADNYFDSVKEPEDVKKVIVKLYKKDKLEGVVFVGDIPIPMLRKAQHMTSAFKMDEKNNDWRDSSVPSDRFYDDFDLQFDFLKQDSVENNFIY